MPFFRFLHRLGAPGLAVAAAISAVGCLALQACIIGPKHDEPARNEPAMDPVPGAADNDASPDGAQDAPTDARVPDCTDGGDSGDAPPEPDAKCGDSAIDSVTVGG